MKNVFSVPPPTPSFTHLSINRSFPPFWAWACSGFRPVFCHLCLSGVRWWVSVEPVNTVWTVTKTVSIKRITDWWKWTETNKHKLTSWKKSIYTRRKTLFEILIWSVHAPPIFLFLFLSSVGGENIVIVNIIKKKQSVLPQRSETIWEGTKSHSWAYQLPAEQQNLTHSLLDSI